MIVTAEEREGKRRGSGAGDENWRRLCRRTKIFRQGVAKNFGRIDGEMGCRMGIRMHANRTLSQLSYRPILISLLCEVLRGIWVFFLCFYEIKRGN